MGQEMTTLEELLALIAGQEGEFLIHVEFGKEDGSGAGQK